MPPTWPLANIGDHSEMKTSTFCVEQDKTIKKHDATQLQLV